MRVWTSSSFCPSLWVELEYNGWSSRSLSGQWGDSGNEIYTWQCHKLERGQVSNIMEDDNYPGLFASRYWQGGEKYILSYLKIIFFSCWLQPILIRNRAHALNTWQLSFKSSPRHFRETPCPTRHPQHGRTYRCTFCNSNIYWVLTTTQARQQCLTWNISWKLPNDPTRHVLFLTCIL